MGKRKASMDIEKWNKAKNHTQLQSVGQNWTLNLLVELRGVQLVLECEPERISSGPK